MVDIVNRTSEDAVYRNGQRLFGMDAEMERKMQDKRDIQFEKELIKWIEEVIGEKLEFQDDIIESLRSGIVLCKVLNVLQPGTIKINKKGIAMMEMENIQLYLKAVSKLGVPSAELFVCSDLYERKGVQQVQISVLSLARLSQTIPNFSGPKFKYKPPTVNLSQPKKRPKWDVKIHNTPVFVTDLENQESKQTIVELKKIKEDIVELNKSLSSKQVEVDELKKVLEQKDVYIKRLHYYAICFGIGLISASTLSLIFRRNVERFLESGYDFYSHLFRRLF